MPVEVESSGRAAVQVRVSAPNELVFSLYVIHRAVHRPGKWAQSWVPRLLEEQPDLAERVANFWEDGFAEWSELLILGQRAGRLWDLDATDLIGEVDDLAQRRVPVPQLPSEAPEARPILVERLERLRADAGLRESYATLMGEVWTFLRVEWERDARRHAEDMAEDLRQRLRHVADFRELLPATHFARRELHQALVERALDRGEVVLVPLALAGIGVGFFALPGVLMVCQGPEAGSKTGRQREYLERSANRFKVLSDPTRVGILAALIDYPYSVTDLAGMFELSQPTVSVHVKALREAGLLESQKRRGQTLYRASRERVKEFVDAALREINC